MPFQRKSSGNPITEHDLALLARLLAASFAGEGFYLQASKAVSDSSVVQRFRQMAGIQRSIIDLILKNLTDLRPVASDSHDFNVFYDKVREQLNNRLQQSMLAELARVEEHLLTLHKQVLRTLNHRQLALQLSEHTAWMQILLDRLKHHHQGKYLTRTNQDLY